MDAQKQLHARGLICVLCICALVIAYMIMTGKENQPYALCIHISTVNNALICLQKANERNICKIKK